MKNVLFLVVLSLFLSACASRMPVMSSDNEHDFVDSASGFHLKARNNAFTLLHDPNQPHYLFPDHWRIDGHDNDPGRLVGVWQMRGSDAVTTAALRYGTSHDKQSLAACLQPGGGWQSVDTDQVTIGGRPFTHFRLSDAGMSHYMIIDAYRNRFHGRCHAIDLVIHGTNPAVYDPPRQPPFTRRQAEQALHELLLKVEWLAR